MQQPKAVTVGGSKYIQYIYSGTENDKSLCGEAPRRAFLLDNDDLLFAVCYVSTRVAHLMIPGRYTCPPNWTREYYGYLMAERYNHHRSTFECVDVSPEAVVGGHADHDGAKFYHVEPRCGSLPCPPYEQEKEITCAICTR